MNMAVTPLKTRSRESAAALDEGQAERLAQMLEEELNPIIQEAIRDAVTDGARRLARDMRKRLDAELSLMIREAVDQARYGDQ